jgi:HPr kinase/phosphorylase|tara:strand:- start:1490 stop:2011 length:522 start_codon:yes stop_codon:yes gene_type:complete
MTGLEQLESHHGVLININGQGVFIRGQSNIGKSSLALELLYQGHQLISDDIAEFKVTPKGIIGYCPPLTSGLLHTKELGLIPVLDLFGKTAWRSEAILSCVILLHRDDITIENHALAPTLEHYTICQTPFPMLRLCTKNPASLSHRIQTWLTLQLHNSNVTSTFMKKHQKALI